MPAFLLTLRATATMLVGKGAAAVAAGALIGTGGVVLVSTQLPSPPSGTHGALVVQAVRETCRALHPGDRAGSAPTPTATVTPGAFGRCVSSVAKQTAGHPLNTGPGARPAGGNASVGHGKDGTAGPPAWAKAKGRHLEMAPRPGSRR